MEEILLNVESKEVRYAHIRNGQLYDLLIERKRNRQITGNVYRGKVTNILHNIQSAFVDINEGINGFIHISDILENSQKFQEMFDMDFDIDYTVPPTKDLGQPKDQDIAKLLKVDHPVLVQVVKEPIGSKGARLTSNVSIAGRYLVLLLNTPHRGVSRKIEDRSARERLKQLIRAFEMPQDMGLICRTACLHASTEMLVDEANALLQTWHGIVESYEKASGPALLFEESDLITRAVMTAVDKKFDRILVDDYGVFQQCKRLYERYKREHPLKVEYYRDKAAMFDRFHVEKEIERALRRKVWLPGGGYLFFDRTEAMTTIDVNSGRSSGQSAGGDVEESLVRINMEAAEEIARQLRLRNSGGLIICDFIDMRSRKNQRRVLDRLKEAMQGDSAKCTILGMSEFGLVEMTRQRNRESLQQTVFTTCPYCVGTGTIKNFESLSIEIERSLKKAVAQLQQFALEVVTHPDVDHYLSHSDKEYFRAFGEKNNAQIRFRSDDTFHLNDFAFYSTTSGKRLDV